MTRFIADNKASRDAVLARVRKALGRTGSDAGAGARADAYVAAHGHGPRPSMPADLVERARDHGISYADIVVDRTFWIGVYPGLGEPELDFVIETLRGAARNVPREAAWARG